MSVLMKSNPANNFVIDYKICKKMDEVIKKDLELFNRKTTINIK